VQSITDIAEVPVQSMPQLQLLIDVGLRSALLIPRICGDGPPTLIAAFRRAVHRWQADEIELIMEIGRRICRRLGTNGAADPAEGSEAGHATQADELKASRDLLQATMDSSMDMIQVFKAVRDSTGKIVDFRWRLNNHTSERRYGEVRGMSLLERNPGVVKEGIFQSFCEVIETGRPQQAERHYVHEQFNGWFLQSVVKLDDGVATTTKEITGWKEAQARLLKLQEQIVEAKLRESESALHERDAWLAAQNEAFKAAMDGAPLEISLGILIDAIVSLTGDGRRCAFYIADRKLEKLAHIVGMPPSYAEAVEGFVIAEDSLACGLAVARGEPVTTADVQLDPLWAKWRWLAQQHGFRGCWSFPVETATGRVVGSFAYYFAQPKEARDRDRELGAAIAKAAAVIFSLHQENEEKVASQERLQLLVAELQHRVRNILSVVRSVLSGTLDSPQTLAEFGEQFVGRLDSLARTQVLVTESAPGRVSLERLIREQLEPGLARGAGTVTVAGPYVLLDAAHAEIVGLAIHELVTNALKHGALGISGARLTINWTVRTIGAEPAHLDLDWRETGVLVAPAADRRRGFGSELIEEALPFQLKALTSFTIEPDGLHCTISFPLHRSA